MGRILTYSQFVFLYTVEELRSIFTFEFPFCIRIVSRLLLYLHDYNVFVPVGLNRGFDKQIIGSYLGGCQNMHRSYFTSERS